MNGAHDGAALACQPSHALDHRQCHERVEAACRFIAEQYERIRQHLLLTHNSFHQILQFIHLSNQLNNLNISNQLVDSN